MASGARKTRRQTVDFPDWRSPFIIDPGPIKRILAHVGEPVEPPPVPPARGPPTEWNELVQAHHDRDVMQDSPDELPVIDIHSL